MKIAVVFTGGTIGSVVKGKWMSTDDSAKFALIANYKKVASDTEFVTSSPYTVLSENLSAKELNLLQKEVEKNLEKDVDGIIVTHGTDSLHYTACALEYAFGNCEIPVVLVSSAYPLEDGRENGNKNFEAAVEFIKSKKAKGVFVSYKNEKETKTNIHIPTNMLQHSELSADIYSITGEPFAQYDGKITLLRGERKVSEKTLGVVEYSENSGILVIDSHPGDGFGYSLDGVKAVILKPYHSATLDTANENLHVFCRKAKEKDIPVFVVGVKSGVAYESTKLFDDIGIIPLPYGTFVSAYMRIWAELSKRKHL
ncbi:MAG: asparaginase [Clostridia bacterium]|nr:asparaginase [Clostridia bacterium]